MMAFPHFLTWMVRFFWRRKSVLHGVFLLRIRWRESQHSRISQFFFHLAVFAFQRPIIAVQLHMHREKLFALLKVRNAYHFNKFLRLITVVKQ